MEVISALEQAYGQTARLVAELTPTDLDALSACPGRDVRATLNHLLGVTWMFTLVNQGQAPDEDLGDVIGDDASLAVTAAAKENLVSWRQPGAFEGDRSYGPFGALPATSAAMFNLAEVVAHNWDVAKAPGRELAIDAAVVQMLYNWGVSIPLDAFRDHGPSGPEVTVPASASVFDRLVGLLGRRP